VEVRRVFAARGDLVHVHVQRPRRPGMQDEAGDAGLLAGFPQRDRVPGILAGIRVAAGLQPALQLAVAQEEDAVAVAGDDDRAARQVALADAAVEGIGVTGHELRDLEQVRGLARVGRPVGIEGTRKVGHPSPRIRQGIVFSSGGSVRRAKCTRAAFVIIRRLPSCRRNRRCSRASRSSRPWTATSGPRWPRS